MSFRASIARIDALVHGIAPKSAKNHAFKVIDAHKLEGDIEGAHGSLRMCAVVLVATPEDDSMAGNSSLRRKAALELRIRYDHGQTSGRRDLDVMIAEDLNSIIDALRVGVTNVATTGLDGVVITGEGATRTPIQVDERPPIGDLVVIPFTILYHEAV